MTPRKVLHIMTRLPVGGVENQLLNILRSYDRTRLFPLVCSLSDRGEFGREIEDAGAEVVCLSKLGHRFDRSIIKDLCGVIMEREVTIVRTHQYHANFYGRLAARKAKVPCVVASVHNIYTRDRKFHRRLMNRYLARFTDRIVAVSEAVKKDILRYDRIPAEKITVIRNGVDFERFIRADGKRVRGEYHIAQATLVIGTVSRLTAQKGHRNLLEAVSSLRSEFPLKLLVVGDGPLRGELERHASRLGLADEVVFTGMRRDVPDLIAAMDIIVLPSLWEGLPNVLLEAFASGRSVIASDIPPFREVIVSPKLGILVPPEDNNALAESIRRLVRDSPLREAMGRAAAEKAASCFSIKKTVSTYTALFEEILKQKHLSLS